MTNSLFRRLERHIAEGYSHLRRDHLRQAVVAWSAAWQLVKQLDDPEIDSAANFERHLTIDLQHLVCWCDDFANSVRIMGEDEPAYREDYLRVCTEMLEHFPDPANHMYMANFEACRGEALILLGRREEAKRHFEEAMSRMSGHPVLVGRYALSFGSEIEDASRPEFTMPPNTRLVTIPLPGASSTPELTAVTTVGRPGRNAPCWCGSGKKYKRCHQASDRAAPHPAT